MAVEEVRLRARPRSFATPATVRARPRHLSVGQRLLFSLALITFGFAAFYTASLTLTRIWPALFPGQTLPFVNKVLPDLPATIGIQNPGAGSVFNKRINILIIGVDRRPIEGEYDGRTDTIMVATVDPVSKESAVLSFPRDLWIDINGPNGTYPERINTSYVAGRMAGGTVEAGAEQLIADMNANFGLEIDHWVVMNFQGVEHLIDAVGGITLDIPYELTVPDWWYSNDDVNAQYVAYGEGVQELDGYNAVAFGRYRNDSDFNRIKRQQLVLRAAVAKVFSKALLNNPTELYNAYRGAVETDIGLGDMVRYAPLLQQTNGRMKTYSVADPVNDVPTVEGWTSPGGAAVLLWDPENVKYWISQAFLPAKYAGVSVEVQDGYGIDGEARAVGLGRYLKYVKALPVVELGPTIQPQPSTTITLYNPETRLAAEDIAKWLDIPAAAIRVEKKTTETQPDIVVAIGRDFRIPSGR
ncbi:MAG: LCP family protein [Dehalococcoidia bacterium]|nr:LCP family protein [Dehalococcoidia bacterium]